MTKNCWIWLVLPVLWKGGRRFRFRATLVIGNRNGKAGVGVAKGADVSEAVRKAFNDAKKKLIFGKKTQQYDCLPGGSEGRERQSDAQASKARTWNCGGRIGARGR